VFVPSLINGPQILDLDVDRSLLRWLAGQGVRPLLVDWGSPNSADSAMTIADHAESLLDGLLDVLSEPAILVGYCLGGAIALGAAAIRRPRAVGLIATPWNYAGFPDTSRAALGALWEKVEPSARAWGLLPMDVLQLAFWQLDPDRTLAKYEAFGLRNDPGAEGAFVPVEDWANDGPPLTLAAARELMEDFFGGNVTAAGEWRIGGRPVEPHAWDVPSLEIVSTTDRIVPAAAAVGLPNRLSLGLGHVGMIVGKRAPAEVWRPLATWLHSVPLSR
jgi:polyhydroxyalkanoate synthase